MLATDTWLKNKRDFGPPKMIYHDVILAARVGSTIPHNTQPSHIRRVHIKSYTTIKITASHPPRKREGLKYTSLSMIVIPVVPIVIAIMVPTTVGFCGVAVTPVVF